MKKIILTLTLAVSATCFAGPPRDNDSFQEGFYALQAEMHQALEKGEIEIHKSRDISKKLKARLQVELDKAKAAEAKLEKAVTSPDISDKLKGKWLKEVIKIKDKKMRKHKKEKMAEIPERAS